MCVSLFGFINLCVDAWRQESKVLDTTLKCPAGFARSQRHFTIQIHTSMHHTLINTDIFDIGSAEMVVQLAAFGIGMDLLSRRNTIITMDMFIYTVYCTYN